MKYTIKHLCYIDAPKEKVFEVLCTIDGLRSWWTPQTNGDPTLHGKLIFEFGSKYRNVMKVITFDPPDTIVWQVIDSVPDWMGTKIRFELDNVDGKTCIRFSHGAYPKQDDFFAECSFSWARYLISIRQLVEKGKGDPYSPDEKAV